MKRHARHAFVAAGPAAPAPASPPSVTAAMSCATPKNTKSASVDATAAAGDANFTNEPITYTKGVAETTNRARATTRVKTLEDASCSSSSPAIPPAVNSNNVAASVGVCKHTSHRNVPHQYASRLMPETICKCLAPVFISRAGNGAAADAESALNDTTTHSDTNNRESSAFSCFSVSVDGNGWLIETNETSRSIEGSSFREPFPFDDNDEDEDEALAFTSSASMVSVSEPRIVRKIASCATAIAAGSAWYAVLEVNTVYAKRLGSFRGIGLEVSIAPGSTKRLAHVDIKECLPNAHVARGFVLASNAPSSDAKASNKKVGVVPERFVEPVEETVS